MKWLGGRADVLAAGFLLTFASGPGQTWFVALFGCCARCGEPIGQARLAIDPAAPSCIRCADA